MLKRSAGDELITAIGTIAKGRASTPHASLASKALARQLKASPAGLAAHSAELSEREREVLTLLARGYSNREIAGDLSLSVKTVETYKVRVGEKLGLRSRAEMVQYALRQGWLNETLSLTPPARSRA